MAKFKSNKLQKIDTQDFLEFTDGYTSLELVDIINDSSKETPEDSFISAPGAFVYELDITVDEKKVINLGVEGIKVQIFNKTPNTTLKSSSSLSKSKLAKNKKKELREFLKSKSSKPILSFNIDLNVQLQTESFQFKTNTLEKVKKTIASAYFSSEPLTSNDLSAVQITTGPAVSNAKNSGVGLNFSEMAKSSIANDGVDPMAMLATATPIYPLLSSHMSKASLPLDAILDSTMQPSANKYNSTGYISLDNIKNRRSLIEERQKVFGTNHDYSSQAIKMSNVIEGNTSIQSNNKVSLGYKADVECTLFSIKREIEISKDALGMRKRFYVKIIPIIRQEKSLIKLAKNTVPLTFFVDHKDQVSDILIPKYPPEISVVKDKPGYVTLKVRQIDPTATKIIVSKRVISPKMGVTSNKTMTTIKMTPSSKTMTIDDTDADNHFPNNIIYRACSIGLSNESGPFSSIVIEGHPSLFAQNVNKNSDNLSIIAVNEKERIKITVEQIPDDVVCIRLLKEEMDETGSLSDRTYAVPGLDGKTMIDVHGVKQTVFYDTDTMINRRYRYFCVMRPRFGGEFLSSSDELIIRKMLLNPLPVEAGVGNLSTNQEGPGQLSVSIDMVSNPKAEGLDFLLSLLEKSGTSQVFIDEVKNQKDALSSLSAFIVERVDRTTGKRISFGLYEPGKFLDDIKTRKKKKIPDLRPNRKYTYFFKLCLRSAQGFFKNVYTNFSSGKTPGVDDLAVLSKKFKSAYSAAFGVLPSDKELSENSSVSGLFKAAETGITLSIDVKTTSLRPTPVNLSLSKKKKSTILTWEADVDNMGIIESCFVFVNHNGVTRLIGTIVYSGTGSRFTFKDEIYTSQVGEKSYFVQFVYTDWTKSAKSNTAKHNILTSLPVAYFAKNKKAKLLGITSQKSKKKLNTTSNVGKSKDMLQIDAISKLIGAPGWLD